MDFTYQKNIDFSLHKVFNWFTNPGFIARACPPFVHLRLVHSPQSFQPGQRISYHLRLFLRQISWELQIAEIVQEKKIVISQTQGPFSLWKYEVHFENTQQTTQVTQKISYRRKGLFSKKIENRLRQTLHYIANTLQNDLRLIETFGKQKGPKRILVSGGSGFIGSALTAFLKVANMEVVTLGRSPKTSDIVWAPKKGNIDTEKLENFDAFIHLAGENIAGRWTQEKKTRIFHSRVDSTKELSKLVISLKNPPQVLITASAIGYYGDRDDEILDETSSLGEGFLADVCKHWEEATKGARASNIRTISTRFGLILSSGGGALQKMLPAFRLGLGGRLGSGKQYVSWIALDDVIGGLYFALMHQTLSGPLNFVSPKPITNLMFSDILAKSCGHRLGPPIPAWVIRLIFGEMGESLFLISSRVEPKRLLENGYHFLYPSLKSTLDRYLPFYSKK